MKDVWQLRNVKCCGQVSVLLMLCLARRCGVITVMKPEVTGGKHEMCMTGGYIGNTVMHISKGHSILT
jgi:hypothetical protein